MTAWSAAKPRLDVVGAGSKPGNVPTAPAGLAPGKLATAMVASKQTEAKRKSRAEMCDELGRFIRMFGGWLVSAAVPPEHYPLIARLPTGEPTAIFLQAFTISPTLPARKVTARRVGTATHRVDIGPPLVCDVIAIEVPA